MEVALSLSGLLATGLQVSDMLNRFVSDVIHARRAIENLKSEVKIFTSIVTNLQTKTSPPPPLDPFKDALIAAGNTLSDLHSELDRVASHGSKLREGIKYACTEKTLSSLLLELMSHKLTLLLFASAMFVESSDERCGIVGGFTRDAAVRDFGSYVTGSANVTSSTATNTGGNPHPTRSRTLANETSTRSVSGTPPPNHNLTAPAPIIAMPYHNVVPSIALYPVPSPPLFTAPEYSLHDAVRNRDKKKVYDLLQRGYNVDQNHPDFGTPLAYAVSLRAAPILTNLLEFGANTKVKDKLGRSLLHTAVVTGDEQILYYVLTMQIPVNEADISGDTALHTAANLGYRKMIDLLIQWGADVERRDRRGLTPWLSPWRVLRPRRRVTVCG